MEISKHEAKEKYYMSLLKRYNDIHKELRKSPTRELDQPYQDGWIMTIDLCDEAKARKDSHIMMEALKACLVNYSTRDAKKVSQVRKIKKLSDLHSLFTRTYIHNDIKTEYYVGPGLAKLEVKKYQALSVQAQKWFYSNTETWSMWGQVYNKTKYHLDIPRHYLVVKTKKRIITKVQDIDPELISERDQLNELLEAYWRTCPGKRHSTDDMRRQVRRHSKVAVGKVIRGEIDELNNYHKLSKLKES